jgi:hypothetical protein
MVAFERSTLDENLEALRSTPNAPKADDAFAVRAFHHDLALDVRAFDIQCRLPIRVSEKRGSECDALRLNVSHVA